VKHWLVNTTFIAKIARWQRGKIAFKRAGAILTLEIQSTSYQTEIATGPEHTLDKMKHRIEPRNRLDFATSNSGCNARAGESAKKLTLSKLWIVCLESGTDAFAE
jgi:hypothetical protein